MRKQLVIATWATSWALAAVCAQAASPTPAVTRFVQRYCMDCHNAESAEGDRSFEPFLKSPAEISHFETLAEIVKQLDSGDMPPREKDVLQPEDAERRAIVADLIRYLGEIESSVRPAPTVMRRLTRYEYNYTIRDLLGIDTAAADRTRLFPTDERVHGFANLAAAQALSDYQLRLYMDAAQQYLDLALVFGREKPELRSWAFKPQDLNGEKHNPGSVRYRVWGKDYAWLDIGHGQPVDSGPTYPKGFARHGVPADGRYRIRVTATAVGRKHPYDPSLYPNDLTVPLQLGLWHVPNEKLLGKRASEGRVLVGVYELPDNLPEQIEATVWMPEGSIPFVHWMNGPGSPKGLMIKLTERYHPEAERKSQTKVDRLREQGLPVPEDALVQKVWISDVYQGPRVRVFKMTLEGPLNDEWPPASHRNIIGAETDPAKVDISKTLTAFASKAFRRPVATTEIEHYVSYVEQQISTGEFREEAIKQGLGAILSSPRFLFLDEGDSARGHSLDDYQLASRLSYALWCSMPDARLVQLAGSGDLSKPEILSAEIDRLLDDPRSAAFVEHFGDAWLQLYKIGSMPPGDKQFPSYYRDRLEFAMKTETRMFIADALKRNLSVTHLLDSNETFVNAALARHYGLADVTGSAFRKVSLPDDAHRAGLLGHASVLTATANGVETSPVVRGIWVLESILGTPPPPPPADVPAIEPDTRGATTIRDQLARHRKDASCATCHARIDPWGVALELYDPIGGYRSHYTIQEAAEGKNPRLRQGQPIDASAELPGGQHIDNDDDMRAELVKRQDQIARALATKFMTHATGREPTFNDRAEIERIVKDAAASGHGVRDLVRRCLLSQMFQNR